MKIIIAHSKKYGDKEIFVDDEDYEYLNKFRWGVAKRRTKWYAQNTTYINGSEKHTYMHRLIMKPENKNVHIDHINNNGFDNRKENLRKCTNGQNMCNRKSKVGATSIFLGVSRATSRRKFLLRDGSTKEYVYEKWLAQIKINGVQTFIGLFKIEEEAARAYDVAAKKYHGEFANLNFPSST